jgi:hypothetical protein
MWEFGGARCGHGWKSLRVLEEKSEGEAMIRSSLHEKPTLLEYASVTSVEYACTKKNWILDLDSKLCLINLVQAKVSWGVFGSGIKRNGMERFRT